MPSPIDSRRSDPVPESMLESGIWVFESQHHESFFMKSTKHGYPKLLYIREGSGSIVARWSANQVTSITCISGDCILIPAKMSHRIVDDPRRPISLYGLAIDPKKIPSCALIETMIPAGRLPRYRTTLLETERRIRRLLYLVVQEGPATSLSAVAGAIDVFAQLAMAAERSKSGTVDQTLDTVGVIDEYLAWLGMNFFEPLTVQSGAKACGMSRRKFTQAFRDRTATTWLHYVNDLRVKHAIGLLEETKYKVTSIAFQSGFEELSTFYRVFKRMSGRQPLEYREHSIHNREHQSFAGFE